MVAVPDARLDKLAEIYEPDKKTPAVIEFVDIAGLVKGASQGAGLGNKFLGQRSNLSHSSDNAKALTTGPPENSYVS